MRPLFLRWLPALLAVAWLLTPPARAEEKYNRWQKNAEQNRYECEYTYTTKDDQVGKQTVIVYPKDNPRAGWAYYVNSAGKPWARCAIKGNPKYDPKVMYWQQINPKGNGYEDYKQPSGYCPAPADGKKPIPAIPDPPV